MTPQPRLWTRLLGRLHGEVPADTLEAYRRASLAVYELLDQVEQGHRQNESAGCTFWSTPPATQIERLCAWNAFVLQILGDQLLEADYRAQPSTAGCVPPITADQVLAFYTQVEEWLSRAHQAHHNPRYRLDVAVPAELPSWSEVPSRPTRHLLGLLEALRVIQDRAKGIMATVADSEPPSDEARSQLFHIRQIFAAATTKARYAEDLCGYQPSPAIRRQVEPHIKEAIELFYRLGQLLAMPVLAEDDVKAPREEQPLRGHRLIPIREVAPLPGQRGFDPWCLTDPEAVRVLKSDPCARRAIEALWKHDPDPARTLGTQAEINDAFARGYIAYATDRYDQRQGHYSCCPWGPAYVVVRPVIIGGKALHVLEQFTYQVFVEGTGPNRKFKRQIAVGTFYPTTRVGYGAPND